MKGLLLFALFLVSLGALEFALHRYIERLRWLVDASFQLALLAVAWALAILGLGAAFSVEHAQIEPLAVAPMAIILLFLFVLAMLEALRQAFKRVEDVIQAIRSISMVLRDCPNDRREVLRTRFRVDCAAWRAPWRKSRLRQNCRT